MFSFFSKYNKTNFKAGGLITFDTPLSRMADREAILTAPNFVAPRKIDNRDMCLATSDQFQTPHCAGYSAAGYCEFQHWKKEHYPEQLDGDAIYEAAKKIDGIPNQAGTYLWSAMDAAISKGLIKGRGKSVNATQQDVKFALHEYGVCMGGLMITTDWNEVEKKTGIIKYTPGAATLGGHAILFCGFDDIGVYIQNSWSENWGIYGFGILRWEQFLTQIMTARVVDIAA